MAKSQSKTSSAADNDLDAITAQLAAMREDIAILAQTISDVAAKKEANLATDFIEGLDAAERYVENSSKSAEQQFEGAVTANPLWAVVLAAGAGFLVGAAVRR